MRDHLARIWPSFLLLTLLGVAAIFFTGRLAIHMLAQPRVWPMFLIIQTGLFAMLFTRFWQRGIETSLVLQNPIPGEPPPPGPGYFAVPLPAAPEPKPSLDPIPDPEPAAPSMDEPDPGVFHHDPMKPRQ
jgi:hypothetical protein